MDFVTFETFSDHDDLPSPQPSLSLPLKSNIENLSAKFHNLKDFTSLLKHNHTQELENVSLGSKLADQYARASLEMVETLNKDDPNTTLEGFSSGDTMFNALSLRLSRALNSSIGDTRLRELITALEPKILDDVQLIDPGIDGSIARKNLRGDIEADIIKLSTSQLADYTKTVTNLKFLGDSLQSLNDLVEDTNSLLAKSSLNATHLRGEVSQIVDDKVKVDMKKSLLVTFREKFTLNEYEEFLLNSNEINLDFFKALERAEAINEACPVLLALDNPELGKMVMNKVSTLVNKARHTIITFCNKALSNTHMLYNQERLSVLDLCLQQFKKRPDQLAVILDAFVEARSSALLNDFDSQMGGQVDKRYELAREEYRPVYYSSHDPLRFITDMLAYVHSSAANESETISGLFKSDNTSSSTCDEIVNRVMTSLSSPVRTKIEQIITVEVNLKKLYQIFNILELYLVMFKKDIHTLGISSSIEGCMESLRQKFKILLTSRLSAVQESNLAKLDLSSDLQPPEWIIGYFSDLLPILDSMQTPTIFGARQDEHEQFLELIAERPTKIFLNHLELVSNKFNKKEKLIFQLNFMDLINSKIMPLSILNDKMLDINHTINDLSAKIVEFQFQALLADCGLIDHYNIMNMIYPTEDEISEASLYLTVSESKSFTTELLILADDKIKTTIPTSLLDMQLNLMRINNPVIVDDIISTCFSRFLTFYNLLTEVVSNFICFTSFNWSANELATLLGIDNLKRV